MASELIASGHSRVARARGFAALSYSAPNAPLPKSPTGERLKNNLELIMGVILNAGKFRMGYLKAEISCRHQTSKESYL
jgi:hypothetical protein